MPTPEFKFSSTTKIGPDDAMSTRTILHRATAMDYPNLPNFRQRLLKNVFSRAFTLRLFWAMAPDYSYCPKGASFTDWAKPGR
jgi:hypothetical protein